MNYHTLGTGIYDKETNLKTRTGFIECDLWDGVYERYPATIYFDVNDFVIQVTKIECRKADYLGVEIKNLNNPQDDIREWLRISGYKSQEIKF